MKTNSMHLMNKGLLLAMILLLPALHRDMNPIHGQDPYREAMTAGITSLDKAGDQASYLACAGQFERIAVAEEDRWLPYYYGAFALIVPSYDEADAARKDLLLDRAQESIDRALELAPDESEIHVLQAFLYPSRILVDPMGRGMIYMEMMFTSLEKAKGLDPGNPRVYFLEGIQKLNLPAAMGGGPEVARPILETAVEKYASFQPDDPLWPSWGEEAARQEVEKLNNL